MSRPMFQLDPRLQAIAARITPGSRIADIGTDHALLPIWLCRSGRARRIVASDINRAPLEQAARNLALYQCHNLVELRRSDGLQGLSPGEVDEIILAGMGGEVIAGIMLGVPWSRNACYRWILQPMSAAERLRDSLLREGFMLESEEAVRSGHWIYTVMTARYTGQAVTLGPADEERWIGRLDPAASPENRQYIRRQQRHIRNLAAGCRARGEEELAAAYDALLERLEKALKEGE